MLLGTIVLYKKMILCLYHHFVPIFVLATYAYVVIMRRVLQADATVHIYLNSFIKVWVTSNIILLASTFIIINTPTV
jgi:hypothetical protein